MLEQILSKLPEFLTIWTSVTLCWGVYLAARLLKNTNTISLKSPQTFAVAATILANVVLMLYLTFEPDLAKTVGDAVIVLNVFYCAFLTTISLSCTKAATFFSRLFS